MTTYTVQQWHRELTERSEEFRVAERRVVSVVPGAGAAGRLAAARALAMSTVGLSAWLEANPGPVPELASHFGAMVADYAEIADAMLSDALDPARGSDAEVLARVGHLVADIKAHEAAINQWQP